MGWLTELVDERGAEALDLHAQTINPQFVRLLRTVGFDRRWARAQGQYLWDDDDNQYLDMLGGEVATHGSIAEGNIFVDDPSDPSVAHLAPRFTIVDELYRITRISRSNVHMLLSIDRNPADGVGTAGAPVDLPISWRKSVGTGRVFYTALGHREEVWQDGRFQQHLLGALRWALGG